MPSFLLSGHARTPLLTLTSRVAPGSPRRRGAYAAAPGRPIPTTKLTHHSHTKSLDLPFTPDCQPSKF
jgi:hypothetical protein